MKIASRGAEKSERTPNFPMNTFLRHFLLGGCRHDLLGVFEISRNIATRKESDARYRGLLEAAPDAMVVVNQGGEIVLLNVQAEKQFGYRRDELVGQKVTNII